MREAISIIAIMIAFVYFMTFGTAVFAAIDTEVHWALAFVIFAAIILFRLWPLLPFLAWYGADQCAGAFPWWLAILLASPGLHLYGFLLLDAPDRLFPPKPRS